MKKGLHIAVNSAIRHEHYWVGRKCLAYFLENSDEKFYHYNGEGIGAKVAFGLRSGRVPMDVAKLKRMGYKNILPRREKETTVNCDSFVPCQMPYL